MRTERGRKPKRVVQKYGSKAFTVILLIILLSIIDAYLTIVLTHRGAIELNPIMAFYLDWSPLAFFGIKYFLTCAAIILFLSVMNVSLFGTRVQGKVMLLFCLVAFGLVVQWELILMFVCHNF